MEALLHSGADVDARNDQGRTPTHQAAQHSGVDMLLTLAEASADLEARDKDGRTPLHIAARHTSGGIGCGPGYSNHFSTFDRLSALLTLEADVNATDTSGATPLHSTTPRSEASTPVQWKR